MMTPSPPQVNPFYIEPNQNNGDEYQYDEEWNYKDTDDLLDNDDWGNNNRGNGRRSRRYSDDKDDWYEEETAFSQRGCILVGCLLIVFILTLTTVASSRDENEIMPMLPVQRIAVLGERNSGADWLESKLRECLPNVEITSSLQRNGYFFQDSVPDDFPTTLVIPVFLNVYDWVERMRKHPMYSPQHNSSLPWETFVTKPWTTNERPKEDERFSTEKGPVCQYHFEYKRVIPCSGPKDKSNDKNHAVYELQVNGAGKPYPSILGLRADKIRNFIETTSQFYNVTRVLNITYESLVEMHHHDGKTVPGLWHVLEHIVEYTGLNYTCTDLIFNSDETKEGLAPPLHTKGLTQDYVDWMNAHVDWSVEDMIGYKKWNIIPEEFTEDDFSVDTIVDDEIESVGDEDDDLDTNKNGNSRDDINDDEEDEASSGQEEEQHQPEEEPDKPDEKKQNGESESKSMGKNDSPPPQETGGDSEAEEKADAAKGNAGSDKNSDGEGGQDETTKDNGTEKDQPSKHEGGHTKKEKTEKTKAAAEKKDEPSNNKDDSASKHGNGEAKSTGKETSTSDGAAETKTTDSQATRKKKGSGEKNEEDSGSE